MMKTVLICHKGDTLTEDGFVRWLSSFTDLVGIVKIQEDGSRSKLCSDRAISVKRGDGSMAPIEFVTGNYRRRFGQYAYWNLKKIAKILAGPLYARLRTFLLARRQSSK